MQDINNLLDNMIKTWQEIIKTIKRILEAISKRFDKLFCDNKNQYRQPFKNTAQKVSYKFNQPQIVSKAWMNNRAMFRFNRRKI